MGDRQRRARIAQDVRDPIGGMIGVERDIGGARLEQRKQRRISFDAAVEQHSDAVSRLDAAGDEKTRHLIRARVELPEGDCGAVEGDCRAVGEAPARVFEHVVEPLAIAPAQGRGVVEDRQRARRLAAAVGRAFESQRRIRLFMDGGVEQRFGDSRHEPDRTCVGQPGRFRTTSTPSRRSAARATSRCFPDS